MCNAITFNFPKREAFSSLVWNNSESVELSFDDYVDASMPTGTYRTGLFEATALAIPDFNPITDQFIIRFVDGKISSELILRTAQGYATTKREDTEWTKRQERNAEKMAKTTAASIKISKPAAPPASAAPSVREAGATRTPTDSSAPASSSGPSETPDSSAPAS
ncbi:hypothetical protein BDK51DRAFT_27786 [Blyttiomyces helicus]|uniref:Uncharacterized protein n=1 Tax=Blyttiomyces helicus TaxID=388810 RepID=A0A4P9WN37_9FUNG|nr:hypothetical protein BDK51DRAFT_27786 [Blyttiomyces helicus]|eukprot:RKO92166.1 hypothetical protein BDK51DRAFT_27786 [Blyttiomyces helicus]